MSKSQKLSYTGFTNDIFESTGQANLVDINDYYRRKADIDTYASLKPSLKPLKWSKNKKGDDQREPDLDALATAQKKIVYIKSFNPVKNEAIVGPDLNAIRSAQNFSNSVVHINEKQHKKKKPLEKIDYNLTISIFKKNREKFNPIVKPVKKNQALAGPKSDESSTLKEFEFLTGVNIQGADQDDQEQHEDYDGVDSNDAEQEYEDGIKQTNQPDSKGSKFAAEDQYGKNSEMSRLSKEQSNLPSLKRNPILSENPGISVSEARYKKHFEKKPKIYISFKTNSVQPYGRPSNYQDHLVRVYNKESTPCVQYPLVNHIAPKKDPKKMILDCYLSQYNLEALKDLDESLYEYAKQQSAA